MEIRSPRDTDLSKGLVEVISSLREVPGSEVQIFNRFGVAMSHTYRETLVGVDENTGDVLTSASIIAAPRLYGTPAFLEDVATHPNQRGKGYGRAVVDAAVQRAFALGNDVYAVKLICKRHRAEFYRQLGFAETDDVCMRRDRR